MTPWTWVFDKVYNTRHEFSPLEQASNPIRRVNQNEVCIQRCMETYDRVI